ncbi:MAG: GAF domain-containing sensor histidine kinase [Chloroflexota bacterium]
MAPALAALREAHQLQRLLEIGRILSSNLDLPSLLQSIVAVASEITGSQGASILLYDPTARVLRFEAIPPGQNPALKKITVPVDSSVAGWVFSKASPLIINDARADPRIYREVDRQIHFQTRSILGVPLVVKQEPIGVLEAVNKFGAQDYTEADQTALETLAAQAAIAIENARLLAKLQEANQELMRLDRMKSDFIAIASHELRTPLGLILGHATFLTELVDEQHQDQIEVIVRSAERLKTIVEDLARISHQEEGQSRVRHRPFSMSLLVQSLVDSSRELAREKKIEFDCDTPSGDPLTVDGDRDKIEIALTNLIRNALIFTDEGGQVGVKAEGSEDYVKVFVVDSGIGIPASSIDRVFQRFYQVESHLTRKHGGMGLGLSIAKAMVEMHHGQIWCESKEGVGSLFCVMLPVTAAKAEAASKVFTTS